MKANKLVFEHVVDVSPRSGIIKLNNKRMVLAATESLGFLRKDLVQTLGAERAKSIFIRYGISNGYAAAKAVMQEFLWRTKDDLKVAVDAGIDMARVATHITEADVSKQHIELSRSLGLETVGFLMMAHMAPTKKLVEEAKKMESYGAEIIYVTDSAGALLPHEVREKVSALRDHVGTKIGFHAHNNLALSMANTLAAVEAGATFIDGSLRSLGAGSGNTQTEVLAAVLERMNIETGIELFPLIDVANEVVAKFMPRSQEIDGSSLILGYAGVYSSFLLFTQEAAKRYGVDERDILIEIGNMQAVGGQEDLIFEVAQRLAQQAITQ